MGEKSANEEREGRILDAAARLITHFGYDKTTVSDIAAEAGVSKGAIYLHWSSKEALFEALLWREMFVYSDEWLARVEADPNGGTFVGMFKNMMLTMRHQPFIMALLKQDQHILGSFIRHEGSRQFKAKMTTNTDFLRMMQEAGAVRRDIDPQVTAYVMNMMAFGLVNADHVAAPEDTPSLERVVDGMAEILERALRPDDGGNTEASKQIIRQVVAAARAQLDAMRDKPTNA